MALSVQQWILLIALSIVSAILILSLIWPSAVIQAEDRLWHEVDYHGQQFFYGAIFTPHHGDPKPIKKTVSNKDLPKEYNIFKDAKYKGLDLQTLLSKNQGRCGSCWTFATTNVLAIRWFKKYHGHHQVNLAPQYLVDCCCSQQNEASGCQGGIPNWVWMNCLRKKGVPLEKYYPYKSGKMGKGGCSNKMGTGNCSHVWDENHHYAKMYHAADPIHQPSRAYITSSQQSPEDRDYAVMHEILNDGPVVMGFRVWPSFQKYGGGVYHLLSSEQGTNPEGGHAVSIIGWGKHKGVPYWLVLNEWGKGWGISPITLKREPNGLNNAFMYMRGSPSMVGVGDKDYLTDITALPPGGTTHS